jgi:hypothetical protein
LNFSKFQAFLGSFKFNLKVKEGFEMNNIVKTIILSILAAILFLCCKSVPEEKSDEPTPMATYKYDVTDEAIIDASIDKVYRAVVDECS